MLEIPDFTTERAAPAEIVDEYRERVPEALVELWERYGFGTFAGGFLRVVDPREHEAALGDTIGKVTGEGLAVPIMTTAMTDLITWEQGTGVTAILHRLGRTSGLGSQLETFVKMVRRNGDRYLADAFAWDPYPKAVEQHGVPTSDQSFVFVPLLSLGGAPTPETMQMRDTITGIQIMVEFQGVVEH